MDAASWRHLSKFFRLEVSVSWSVDDCYRREADVCLLRRFEATIAHYSRDRSTAGRVNCTEISPMLESMLQKRLER
jgi:hypothetical protein